MEIVRAMIQKESYGFNTYAAVRVGEIQEGTSPNDWYWIEGRLNISDWITRGKSPRDLHEKSLGLFAKDSSFLCGSSSRRNSRKKSLWQRGPDFFRGDLLGSSLEWSNVIFNRPSIQYQSISTNQSTRNSIVTPEILLIVNRYRVAASDATRPSCFSERKQWFFLVFRNMFEEMTTWASPSTVF